jgi:hypothetical protein
MARTAALLLLAVALTAIGTRTFLRPAEPHGADRDQSTDALTELTARLASLERRVQEQDEAASARLARPERPPQAAFPAAVVAPSPHSVPTGRELPAGEPEDPEVLPSQDEPESPEQREQKRANYRITLDDAIFRQGYDYERREVFETHADEVIGAFEGSGIQVEDIACSAAFCRLVTRHADRESQFAFLDQIQGRPGFLGEGIAHVEPDGLTFVYVAQGEGGFPQP